MLRATKIAALGALTFMVWGYQPAAAGCDVISATHSAESKEEALSMSRRLVAESALEVRRKKGWKYLTMSAYKVKPDPFWKSTPPAPTATGYIVLLFWPAGRRSPPPRRRSRLTLATTNGKLSVTMFWCDGVEAGFDS